MKIKKFIFLILFLLFIIQEILVAEISFRFCVMGDSRTQTEIFRKSLQQINELQPSPSFIISVGDFINGYKSINRIKKEWEEMFFAPLREELRFGINFYPVPGNHDICNSMDIYQYYLENVYPYTYYYFVFNNSLFIILSSEELDYEGKISDSQYRWIRKILLRFAKEKFIKHKFVFVHRPFFPYKTHLRDSLNQDKEMRTKLMELFKKSKVDIIFCGHCHLFHLSRHNGITQIITGGAGAPLHSRDENEGIYHFLIVDVVGNKFKVLLKDLNKTGTFKIFEK